MRFEWDDEKNLSNQRKHGISFDVAIAVFDDPLHLMEMDRIVDGELRWRTTGELADRHLVLAAHTYEEEGEEVIRVISARAATTHERREYEGDS